jgi:hypothetical protein
MLGAIGQTVQPESTICGDPVFRAGAKITAVNDGDTALLAKMRRSEQAGRTATHNEDVDFVQLSLVPPAAAEMMDNS